MMSIKSLSMTETYNGRYVKGPKPSPPPNVRELCELEFGPEVPPAQPRSEGPGLWDDWSDEVRTIAASN